METKTANKPQEDEYKASLLSFLGEAIEAEMAAADSHSQLEKAEASANNKATKLADYSLSYVLTARAMMNATRVIGRFAGTS